MKTTTLAAANAFIAALNLTEGQLRTSGHVVDLALDTAELADTSARNVRSAHEEFRRSGDQIARAISEFKTFEHTKAPTLFGVSTALDALRDIERALALHNERETHTFTLLRRIARDVGASNELRRRAEAAYFAAQKGA